LINHSRSYTKDENLDWELVAYACNPSYSEAEIRRITFQSQPGQMVCKTLSEKTLSQKVGLVEWPKVKA
jgi:hypothetical protein